MQHLKHLRIHLNIEHLVVSEKEGYARRHAAAPPTFRPLGTWNTSQSAYQPRLLSVSGR